MADLLSGLVVNVTSIPVGTQTTADAAIGDTVLPLDDVIYLSPTGGQVTIDGTVTDYTESDDDESTITLSAPLTAAVLEGADVSPYPPRVEVTALVLVDGASDPIPATVPWNLQDSLRVGVREEENREQVTLQRDGQWSWAVYNLDGQILTRDPAYIGGGLFPASLPSDAPFPSGTETLVNQWVTGGAWDFNTYAYYSTLGEAQVKTLGTYQVSIAVRWAANSSGRRQVKLVSSWAGVETDVVAITVPASDSGPTSATFSVPVAAFEMTTFRVEVFQNSGASLNVLKVGSYFRIVRLR